MSTINPIDLEILWNRLIAIVDEAGAALEATSFSTVVRESNDFASVLLDAEGRLLVQSTISVPGFIGTASLTLRHMLKVHPPETLTAGDILFTNDPWIGTGHLPDVTMAAPIYAGDRLIAFIVTIAHLSDIGGRQWSADANEVFEEGVRFPVSKLARAGIVDQLILDILSVNVRLPGQVRGDINAMMIAIKVAERRLREMMAEYALDDLEDVAEAIYRVSEEALRREIEALPEGTYIGEVEADGWEEPVRIRAAVTISDTGIGISYAGSSPQSRYGINESYNHTYAYTVYPFKCMLCPDIPNNDGFLRLFTVDAPEGTIVNSRPPAAVGARQLVGHVLQGALFEAMADVMPERVQADSGTPIWTLVFRGVDPVREASFSTILFFNGGMGAMQGRPGLACTSFPGNISNTPIEMTETLAPLIYEEKRIVPGSGGAGAMNGGDAQAVAIRSRWPTTVKVSLLTERIRTPARGLFGGEAGDLGMIRKNGEPVALTKGTLELEPGDLLELQLPGGGGYGVADGSG